jgi:anhydro-N-acetylmuramic acid kinase
MRMLADRFAPATVETADAAGWNADALEAQAFAYLAIRTLHGLPLTFPTTTGVTRPLAGGRVAHGGEARVRLRDPADNGPAAATGM